MVFRAGMEGSKVIARCRLWNKEPVRIGAKGTLMQLSLEKVRIDDSIIEYIVEIIYRTREDPRVKVGSSPRGAQSLFKLS